MKAFVSRSVTRRTYLTVAVATATHAIMTPAACTAPPDGSWPTAASSPTGPVPATATATVPPTATATATATASSTVPATVPATASASASSAASGSVVGLPGWLYYLSVDRSLYRLTPAGLELVLTAATSVTVSPDGAWIAYVNDSGELIVTDRDGGRPRSVLLNVAQLGYEPAWSQDARRLLVARNPGQAGGEIVGVVEIATGVFTALPHQIDGIHPLWSADEQRLAYATGTCQIMVADADGGNASMVPVFGDRDVSVNPQRRRSCDPYSISPDGTLVAVNQRTGNQPDGDLGRDVQANAVIDTRTGADVPLPVSGQISAVLFQPDGHILVRSTDANITTLTLLNPNHTINTQVTEPANLPCGEYPCLLLTHTPN